MSYKRVEGRTPSGGNETEEENALRCIIRECKFDGTLLRETYGICNRNKG